MQVAPWEFARGGASLSATEREQLCDLPQKIATEEWTFFPAFIKDIGG
jgi:hypothetical protein